MSEPKDPLGRGANRPLGGGAGGAAGGAGLGDPPVHQPRAPKTPPPQGQEPELIPRDPGVKSVTMQEYEGRTLLLLQSLDRSGVASVPKLNPSQLARDVSTIVTQLKSMADFFGKQGTNEVAFSEWFTVVSRRLHQLKNVLQATNPTRALTPEIQTAISDQPGVLRAISTAQTAVKISEGIDLDKHVEAAERVAVAADAMIAAHQSLASTGGDGQLHELDPAAHMNATHAAMKELRKWRRKERDEKRSSHEREKQAYVNQPVFQRIGRSLLIAVQVTTAVTDDDSGELVGKPTWASVLAIILGVAGILVSIAALAMWVQIRPDDDFVLRPVGSREKPSRTDTNSSSEDPDGTQDILWTADQDDAEDSKSADDSKGAHDSKSADDSKGAHDSKSADEPSTQDRATNGLKKSTSVQGMWTAVGNSMSQCCRKQPSFKSANAMMATIYRGVAAIEVVVLGLASVAGIEATSSG